MSTTRRQSTDQTLQYLVQRSGQPDIIIEVRADWKLTFGNVNPRGSDEQGGYRDRSLHCLRIWEGEKLRAVFCDVRGFRDLSIPLASKVAKETGSATWTSDSTGNFEKNEKREVEFELLPEGDGPVF